MFSIEPRLTSSSLTAGVGGWHIYCLFCGGRPSRPLIRRGLNPPASDDTIRTSRKGRIARDLGLIYILSEYHRPGKRMVEKNVQKIRTLRVERKTSESCSWCIPGPRRVVSCFLAFLAPQECGNKFRLRLRPRGWELPWTPPGCHRVR